MPFPKLLKLALYRTMHVPWNFGSHHTAMLGSRPRNVGAWHSKECGLKFWRLIGVRSLLSGLMAMSSMDLKPSSSANAAKSARWAHFSVIVL